MSERIDWIKENTNTFLRKLSNEKNQEDEFWEQVAREVESVPITKIEWREVE